MRILINHLDWVRVFFFFFITLNESVKPPKFNLPMSTDKTELSFYWFVPQTQFDMHVGKLLLDAQDGVIHRWYQARKKKQKEAFFSLI